MVLHLHPAFAPLHWPGQPHLNKNEASFVHRGSHCAICWVKHAGPLLKCHDTVCLEGDKSPQAVTSAVLRHYSQLRGALLMLTNTVEWGSFTTHPLSRCQYCTGSKDISQFGQVCMFISVPYMTIYSKCWIWISIKMCDNVICSIRKYLCCISFLMNLCCANKKILCKF